MPEILEYLLQVNISIGVFYLLYHWIFRSFTFYRTNRFLLIFGLLFSLVYPFIRLPHFFSNTSLTQGAYNLPLSSWSAVEQESQAVLSNFWVWLEGTFWLLTCLMALRLVLRFASLYQLHRSTSPASFKGYTYRQLGLQVNPFSFWKTIYINPVSHAPEELEAILKHEQLHVAGYHTLDVLLAEVILLFCWMNPAMWLTKKAISENLEFITDRQLLIAGMESRQYQFQLLKICQLAQVSSLVNNFNFITIKTRISMMNKKRSASFLMFSYALLLPVAFGFVTACNLAGDHEQPQVLKEMSSVNRMEDSEVIYYLNGVVVDKAAIDRLDPQDIAQVDVLKGDNAQEMLGDINAEGAVMVTTRPAKGDVVKVNTSQTGITREKNPPLSDMLIMVDGEEVSRTYLEALAPDKIERMDVLKGEQATNGYGEKGKVGVVMITTKK